MNARLAFKLGILAIAALAFLSGCILVENRATIVFDNNSGITLECWFDDEYVGTVGIGGELYYTYNWIGSTSILVYWEVYVPLGGLFADDLILVQDGGTSIIGIAP